MCMRKVHAVKLFSKKELNNRNGGIDVTCPVCEDIVKHPALQAPVHSILHQATVDLNKAAMVDQ